MKPKTDRIFYLILAGLFLLNLLQSAFTGLLFDEAYYWYYAQDLAWGYFDHPPMVALMVWAGSQVFTGELGVRFISCLFSVGSLSLLWQILPRPLKYQYVPHFFGIAFSMTLINAYGFFTLPDTPLLFFTALFLLFYKRFLEKPSTLIAIALGLSMAGLMYSKYHAFLVIFFVFLSHLRLVRNPLAWLAVGVGILCYLPHIFWLAAHDFVSIRYHLFERPNRAYEFYDFTLGFLLNLIAIFGLTFPWMYQALFKTRARDPFTRALLFLVYGVLLFFFLSSFQRRVQTQWIIVVCIPMILLVFEYMASHPLNRKWLMRTASVNIGILLILRIGLVYPPLFPIVFETHGNKEWVNEITQQAGNLPVIFENSYRQAPMYAFYSGNPSYSLNNVYYRENQYNIDGSESRFQGKKVLFVGKGFKNGDVTYSTASGKQYFGKYRENFESHRELECKGIRRKGDTVMLQVHNPYQEAVPLKDLNFGVAFLNGYKEFKELVPVNVQPSDAALSALPPASDTEFSFKMPNPRKGEAAYMRMSISDHNLPWGLNGPTVNLETWNP